MLSFLWALALLEWERGEGWKTCENKLYEMPAWVNWLIFPTLTDRTANHKPQKGGEAFPEVFTGC